MTESDIALLICLADCINLAETEEIRLLYLEMVLGVCSMYLTTKENENGTK